MQTAHQPNIFIDRDDTFFGVCEAIGEDFGFHANWLRLALAVGTFFSPLATVAAYGALAVVVGISRRAFPNPAPAAPEAAPEPAVETNDTAQPLAEAA